MLLGPPGSGKGTQGKRLAVARHLVHLSTGELLRAEVAADTELGREVSHLMSQGQLVPDDTIVELMLPAMVSASAAGGYILDGFPRSVEQAKMADRLVAEAGCAPEAVLLLDVPRELLLARMLRRANLEGRADDTPAVIAHRLRVYDESTAPLRDYFAAQGLLHVIDAAGDPDDVARAVAAVYDESHLTR